MDYISLLRRYSFVFLILSAFLGAIAVGVVPAPAAPTGAYAPSEVSVTGGGIESALWSFDPYSKLWHFEIKAGASFYRMIIGVSEKTVDTDKGTYKVRPYTLTVDLSSVEYALPMKENEENPIYGYKFVDCGVRQVPYNVWVDFLSRLNPAGPVTYTVSQVLQSAATRDAYVSAYYDCQRLVSDVESGINSSLKTHFIFLSVEKRTETINLGPITIYSQDVYDPHYYGVVKYVVSSWKPKVSSELYPTGVVKVNLTNYTGETETAEITLHGPSDYSPSAGGVTGVAQLGNIGTIRYVGYISDTGDVYSGLGDPYIINYNGFLTVVDSSGVKDVSYASQLLDSYITTGMASKYLVSGALGLDNIVQKLGSYGMDRFYQESQQVRSQIQSDVSAVSQALDSAVNSSPWISYVRNVRDVPNTGVLLLVPPSGQPNFKILLAGDINAEWLGLEHLVAHGRLVDVPNEVNISRTGLVSVRFGVQNVSDVEGSFSWSIICGDYGILDAGYTQSVRPGETIYVTATGALPGITQYTKPMTISCTLTLKNGEGTVDDTAAVNARYVPDVVCPYVSPTCGEQNGISGIFSCTSPYAPAQFTPCLDGYTCQYDAQGNAQCVKGEGSKPGYFCEAGKICHYDQGQKVCESCGGGYTCQYVVGEGARCQCVDPTVCGETPPQPEGVVLISADVSKVPLWRFGAGLAALGSLLLWVMLV